MAIEEISFYNILGEEISISNLVNQMIDYYQQKIEVGETKITDFNQGSEIRNLLEAFAVGLYALLEQNNELAKKPFIRLSSDEWLDRIGEYPFINLPRKQGAYATGTVTFTLKEVQTTDFIVPVDTIVVDSVTGLDFITTSECLIPVGELSAEAVVECLTEGSDGNSKIGDINIISDTNTEFNTDLLTVSNSEAFDTGVDYEDDEDYRIRLLENVRADGFGTLGYYKKLGESVAGVHDVLLVSDRDYTRKVLVNGFTKPVSDEIILEVLNVFTNLDNLVLNHKFTVEKVPYTPVKLDLNITSTKELDLEEVKKYLVSYVDGTEYNLLSSAGFNINQALTIEDLNIALSVFDGFVNVTADFTKITPTENSVLQITEINITQNVV